VFVLKILKFSFIHVSYSLLILIGSVIPVDQDYIPKIFSYDKLIHFIAYCALAVLSVYAYKKVNKIYVKGFIFTFSWGLLIELIQYFLPYRFFDLSDIFINGLGALAGVGVLFALNARVKKRGLQG